MRYDRGADTGFPALEHLWYPHSRVLILGFRSAVVFGIHIAFLGRQLSRGPLLGETCAHPRWRECSGPSEQTCGWASVHRPKTFQTPDVFAFIFFLREGSANATLIVTNLTFPAQIMHHDGQEEVAASRSWEIPGVLGPEKRPRGQITVGQGHRGAADEVKPPERTAEQTPGAWILSRGKEFQSASF